VTDLNNDFLEWMNEKGHRPQNKREQDEQDDRNVDIVDSQIKATKKMPNAKGILANNSGRSGEDVIMTEVEKKDVHSFMQGDRERIEASGFVDLLDESGKKIGVMLQMSDARADAVEAGEYCGRCGDPQVAEHTKVCTPISRGGLALGCGYPRYGKM